MATQVNNQQGLAIVIENNINIVKVKGELLQAVKQVIQRNDKVWKNIEYDLFEYAIGEKTIDKIQVNRVKETFNKETLDLCVNLIKEKRSTEILNKLRMYKMTNEENNVLTIVK